MFWIIPIIFLLLASVSFFVYTSNYYHADEIAFEALKTNDNVKVTKENKYYLFDGNGDKNAIIFYPGAKVETEAYAPFCMLLSNEGVDVFLVDMPFHLALFGKNRANDIINNYNYNHYYVGGHSLGGATAALYAYKNADKVDGVIMLAAYSAKKLDEKLNNILIYGSNDKVLNINKYNDCLKNVPNYVEKIIEGGNHSGFAYYGNQKGDGNLNITKDEQIKITIDFIINNIDNK